MDVLYIFLMDVLYTLYFNEKEDLNYVSLPVFGIDNTELTKYWKSGDIRVIVNYRVGGEKESLIFEFQLWKGREIVWPT